MCSETFVNISDLDKHLSEHMDDDNDYVENLIQLDGNISLDVSSNSLFNLHDDNCYKSEQADSDPLTYTGSSNSIPPNLLHSSASLFISLSIKG